MGSIVAHHECGNTYGHRQHINIEAGRENNARSIVTSSEGYLSWKASGLKSMIQGVRNTSKPSIQTAGFHNEFIKISRSLPVQDVVVRRNTIIKNHALTMLKMLPSATPEALRQLQECEPEKMAGFTLALHGAFLIRCQLVKPAELVSFIIKNADVKTVASLCTKKDLAQLSKLAALPFENLYKEICHTVYEAMISRQEVESYSGRYHDLYENFCRYLECRATGNEVIGGDAVRYGHDYSKKMLGKKREVANASAFFERLAMKLIDLHITHG